MSIKENGKTIKLMGKVCICTRMDRNIMGIGLKITNKVLALNNGLMGLLMRGIHINI